MSDIVKILVAEDDDQLRETLVTQLSGVGYDVMAAASGNDAIPLVFGREFQLIVLDLKMPYIDGFEVLKFVKSSFPKTKVIILTAYGDLLSREKCKELGADEVIGKPYNLEDLFRTIENLVKK